MAGFIRRPLNEVAWMSGYFFIWYSILSFVPVIYLI